MNNVYQNLPAFMSDGRIFTDYRPNVDLNNDIKGCLVASNENEYREKIQTNGMNILDQPTNKCINDKNKHKSFFPYFGEGNEMVKPKQLPMGLTNPGFKYLETCDSNNCKRETKETNGIGTKRVY